MDVQAIGASNRGNAVNINTPIDEAAQTTTPVVPTAPSGNSVQAFDQVMKNSQTANAGTTSDADTGNQQQLEGLLKQLIQLIQQMLTQVGNSRSGEGKAFGGSSTGSGSGVTPVNGSGPGGSAGNSSGLIPKPSEHIQQLNLGGKTVTVGGDGTSSAEEVGATAQSIQNLYQNSPTFKGMVDNSSDPSFEVSVGRRDDNTSWGNSGGRVFMNINNINPGNTDAFQSLLGHEFAHASIDIGHGGQMEQIQDAVAREA